MNSTYDPIPTARDLAGAILARNQFIELAAACIYDPRFPVNYEAWQALIKLGDEVATAEGQTVLDVEIDVAVFIAWCQRVQVQPGTDALRAYLTLLR